MELRNILIQFCHPNKDALNKSNSCIPWEDIYPTCPKIRQAFFSINYISRKRESSYILHLTHTLTSLLLKWMSHTYFNITLCLQLCTGSHLLFSIQLISSGNFQFLPLLYQNPPPFKLIKYRAYNVQGTLLSVLHKSGFINPHLILWFTITKPILKIQQRN